MPESASKTEISNRRALQCRLTVDDLCQRLSIDIDLGFRLAVKRQDGAAAVAPDDGHLELLGVGTATQGVGDEGRGPHDIERRDSEETGWVKHTLLPEGLGCYGDGRVDGVGDDAADRLGASSGNLGENVADYACICLGANVLVCYYG